MPIFSSIFSQVFRGAPGWGKTRKRVPELGPIAVACLFVGDELGFVVLLLFNGQPLGIELLLGPILLLGRSLTGIGLLVGALLAWMRVR